MKNKIKGHWSKKIGLTGPMIYKYLRFQLGYAFRPHIKQQLLVCEALAKAGNPKPEGKSPAQWIADNVSHIKEIVGSKESIQIQRAANKVKTTSSKTDDFLNSFQWRKLRMQALIRYGRRCMCCGATPDNGAVMNVDHIKPRRFYPSLALDLDNLQILCHDCNHGKGNWDQTDWRPRFIDLAKSAKEQ